MTVLGAENLPRPGQLAGGRARIETDADRASANGEVPPRARGSMRMAHLSYSFFWGSSARAWINGMCAQT